MEDTAPADDAAAQDTEASDKPFEDEPFDAGVEADEEEDPKKFIQQLTGKLGQSLRKYTEDQGEPDLELEKFAINSLLSATHTSQMDDEDKDDIIKKVKTSGEGDEESTDTGEETAPEGEEATTDAGGETAPEGEEAAAGGEENQAAADEVSNDENNLFEVDMIDEMSLSDWKVKLLIKMYDEGDDNVKNTLTRLISFEKMLEDPEKNKKRFLKDLEEDHSNSDIIGILEDLKEMGIDIPEYFNDSKIAESFFLTNPKKNNMFQEGSNDILDEYEVYEVVEEGKKKTKKDACYHKVRARYDVWPSAYASGALVKCRKVGAANWGNSDESVEMNESDDIKEIEALKEKWSKKYNDSIDCNNPKGFSQKAFCQGKKK